MLRSKLENKPFALLQKICVSLKVEVETCKKLLQFFRMVAPFKLFCKRPPYKQFQYKKFELQLARDNFSKKCFVMELIKVEI